MDRNSHRWVKVVTRTVLGYFVFITFFLSIPAIKFLNGIAQDYLDNETRPIVIGETEVYITEATTPFERDTGLGGRESLGENEGLLFVFDESDYHAIWMKNMNFPIDAIWINKSTEVVHIEENISPDTFPEAFVPNQRALYVLEVNAGFVRKNGIKVNDLLALP